MLVFVVGTGTDVGKTYVTAALVGAAGAGAKAWKPVATGVTDELGDDARAIGATEPPLFAFERPISPHLAARAAGVTITAAAIADKALALAERCRGSAFFVESAGGLFSPISDTETNHDVALALAAGRRHATSGAADARATRDDDAAADDVMTLLVAPDRLGVLHDVGATIRAATIAMPILALSDPAVPDASAGTNAAELVRLGLARVVVEFPRGHGGCTAATRLLTALRDALPDPRGAAQKRPA